MHTASAPTRRRFTVSDFYRMDEAGIFGPEERVELVEGDVLEVPRDSSQRAATLSHLAALLYKAIEDLAHLRVKGPISFDTYSEFQPSLAVASPRADYYMEAHPRADQVLLIAEITDAAVRQDREAKLRIYARHGVPEVWVIDVESLGLMRHRNPVEAAYAAIDEPSLDTSLSLLALPKVSVTLSPLFAHVSPADRPLRA